jgi:hypothetical protein
VLVRAEILRRVQAQSAECAGEFAIPTRVIVRGPGNAVLQDPLRRAIAEFLRQENLSFDLSTLHWPGEIVTGGRLEGFQVTDMRWDARRSAVQWDIQCVPRNQCGRFLAEAVSTTPPVKTKILTLSLPAQSRTLLTGPALARAGTRAVLTADLPGLRFSLPVICLERGMLGQRIRVLDRASRNIFTAEVIGEGRLRLAF